MILILSGLPASGKSTYAKKWLAEDPSRRVRVNYDDLRLEMFGPDWVFNRHDEARMKLHAQTLCAAALAKGQDVIIDNTNLTEGARKPWVELGKRWAVTRGKFTVEYHEIDTPISTCCMRDLQRPLGIGGRVGRAVIDSMALRTGRIDWSYYSGQFVIVDVDGTLADCSERQKHLQGGKKDWKSFFQHVDQDPPRQVILDLVGQLDPVAYRVIIVSGRPIDQCGIQTEDWLNRYLHAHRFIHMFMRAGGDSRPDTTMKQEILDLLPKDRIAFVIDDRPSVVRMWRQNGLTTLDVGNGEEF